MFEILTILSLYSRGSMYERLKLLYTLYSSSFEDGLTPQEFEFLVGKVSTSIGSTLSVKKSLLHDLVQLKKDKLIPLQS